MKCLFQTPIPSYFIRVVVVVVLNAVLSLREVVYE